MWMKTIIQLIVMYNIKFWHMYQGHIRLGKMGEKKSSLQTSCKSEIIQK